MDRKTNAKAEAGGVGLIFAVIFFVHLPGGYVAIYAALIVLYYLAVTELLEQS